MSEIFKRPLVASSASTAFTIDVSRDLGYLIVQLYKKYEDLKEVENLTLEKINSFHQVPETQRDQFARKNPIDPF